MWCITVILLTGANLQIVLFPPIREQFEEKRVNGTDNGRKGWHWKRLYSSDKRQEDVLICVR